MIARLTNNLFKFLPFSSNPKTSRSAGPPWRTAHDFCSRVACESKMHSSLPNRRKLPVGLLHISLGQRIKRLRDALPLTLTRSVSKLVLVTTILPLNDLTLLLLLFLSLDVAVTLLLYDNTFNLPTQIRFRYRSSIQLAGLHLD